MFHYFFLFTTLRNELIMSEINDALGVENTPQYEAGYNSAEKVLTFVAYTILLAGIVGTIILSTYTINNEKDSSLGLTYLIGGILTSLISWATCMVLVNISNNIRGIKRILANKG